MKVTTVYSIPNQLILFLKNYSSQLVLQFVMQLLMNPREKVYGEVGLSWTLWTWLNGHLLYSCQGSSVVRVRKHQTSPPLLNVAQISVCVTGRVWLWLKPYWEKLKYEPSSSLGLLQESVRAASRIQSSVLSSSVGYLAAVWLFLGFIYKHCAMAGLKVSVLLDCKCSPKMKLCNIGYCNVTFALVCIVVPDMKCFFL